jgi:hypothetical protein
MVIYYTNFLIMFEFPLIRPMVCLVCTLVLPLTLHEVGWAESSSEGVVEGVTGEGDGRIASLSEFAAALATLDAGKRTSLRFGEVIAKGPDRQKWEGNLAPIKANLKQDLGKYSHLVVSDTENLKSVEENAALDGRNVRIEAADYEVKMIARQIDRHLVLEFRILKISNASERTYLLQMDPRSVGIDPEAEIPPADAAVKVADKTMMDIAEKLFRNMHLEALVAAEESADDGDGGFAKSISKNIQSNNEQIARFARQTIEEISELMRLDEEVVRQSLEDRQDFLLVEGRLQGVDTSRQRNLVKELSRIWEKAKDSGIKPNEQLLVESCLQVIKSEG